MKRFRTLSGLFMALCLAMLLVAGCDDPSDSGDDNEEEELKNPNPPTANHLLIDAKAYGDPAKGSEIWDMDGNQTDGFYFIGNHDYVVGAGLMTASGTWVWDRPLTYDPRQILSVQSGRFTGGITVGALDSDEDGSNDQGIATLITPGGSVQYQIAVSDTAPAWFNGVTFLSDSIFLCVGASWIVDTYYPFLSVLYLSADATLHTASTAILTDLPSTLFLDVEPGVVKEDTQTGRLSLDCYVDANCRANDAETITLHALRCPLDSLAGTEIFWSRDIIAYPGLGTRIYTGKSLTLANNGNLYIAGRTDVNKDPAPGSGGYWPGGLITSVTTLGTVNWVTPVVLSQYSDYYYSPIVTDQGLFAVGRYSSFYNTGTDRLFGYGLISKFDPMTGDAEYHLSFGNDQYSSGFRTFHIEGVTAWAGGWTYDYKDSDGFQAWFASIDLSAPATSPELLKQAPAGTALADTPDSAIRHRDGARHQIR